MAELTEAVKEKLASHFKQDLPNIIQQGGPTITDLERLGIVADENPQGMKLMDFGGAPAQTQKMCVWRSTDHRSIQRHGNVFALRIWRFCTT